jgi:glycosyltransferase involved in cell wall biosynthesis
MSSFPEITVVIPCLNEELTVVACVKEALEAFRTGNLAGEVVVADNGSTDDSRALAPAWCALKDAATGLR